MHADPAHARVAEGVRLHPGEVEELGDALVGRSQQLGVDVRRHRRPRDRVEPVPGEEVDLERQAEHPAHADVSRAGQQLLQQHATDAASLPRLVDDERAHLGEVLPHHVQGAAADHGVRRVDRDQELLDVLVVGDRLLAEQDAVVGVPGHEAGDRPDVGGPGPAERERPGVGR
jgi:hypothetical protein